MPVTQSTSDPLDTPSRILDTAERLFVENGFAATSMRAIAVGAGVNLAATNYHFGSKKGLLAAVFHRRVQPINAERLLRVNALIENEKPLNLRPILEAFFMPFVENLQDGHVPAIAGCLFSEPETISKPILESEFSEVAATFQAAISQVLPNLPEEALRWRFHLMIGSMIHLLRFQTPLGSDSSVSSFGDGIHHLIDFAAAGLAQADREVSQ